MPNLQKVKNGEDSMKNVVISKNGLNLNKKSNINNKWMNRISLEYVN